MSDGTLIEWADASWPVTSGCAHVSEGCDCCYAARLTSGRLRHHPAYAGLAVDGRFTGQVRCLPDRLGWPARWRKPRRVFVASMSDLFHAGVPDVFLDQVFDVMAALPRHTFIVLTKRHARMAAYLRARAGRVGPPAGNVWVGVSVEDQRWANTRLPALIHTPAAVRWASVEPLLGPVDLTRWLRPAPDCGHADPDDGCCLHPAAPHAPECHSGVTCPLTNAWGGLDWVVTGGETGPDRRDLDLDWIRSVRDQCTAAGVAYFHKQNTGPTPTAAGRELDGRIHDQYPPTPCVGPRGAYLGSTPSAPQGPRTPSITSDQERGASSV